jgi:hypothetical protein
MENIPNSVSLACPKCQNKFSVKIEAVKAHVNKPVLIKCRQCNTPSLYTITPQMINEATKPKQKTHQDLYGKTMVLNTSESIDSNTRPLKLKIIGTESTKEQILVLNEGENTIGRLYLKTTDTTISREHCIISVNKSEDGYTYAVQDNKSLNGTFVNGKRLSEYDQVYISSEDTILLNKTKVKLI